MLDTEDERATRAAVYRENAITLRRLAAEIRFDFCRREQLCVLAGAFDRLADRVAGPALKEAAD